MAGTGMIQRDQVLTVSSNRRNGGQEVKLTTFRLQTEERNFHHAVCIILLVTESNECNLTAKLIEQKRLNNLWRRDPLISI